jgi:hypothetical protein
VKGKSLNEFLAAPATVLEDKRERAKAVERKAKERANAARLLAAKSKTPPSVEDLLADIVRVADDEATNPWHEFRSISRRRYELFGHYPVLCVDRQFGTFAHAKEVAGLADQAGTRLWRRKRAQDSREEHAARYFKRYIAPYVAGAEASRALRKPYLLLSISDTHSQFLCPFVWTAFLQAIRDLKPDGVLLNGDVMEGSEISSHPKIPGWTQSLQSELTFQREMYRQIREVHDGDLFSTGGNHDIVDRLARYLTQVATALAGVPDLRADRLMGLDKYDVQLLHGGTIVSPAGTDDAKPGFLLFGFYRVHHGTLLGQDPARAELRAAGRSGQSGHVHRAALAYGTTERDEGLSWMCTPMGARHEVGRAYIKGSNTGWQRGIGAAWLYPDGTVQQHPCVVQAGKVERLTVEGFTYERPAWMHDPEPQGNWLADWKATAAPTPKSAPRRAARGASRKKKARRSRQSQ